ncbi:hypothetical protein [Streptomyces orinoci]|uniref:hypothetical protein n=1 Tax=Streptomyces orinoci TaxID=67339 RepID=UPI000D655B56|nr:hypothetical protein [Streptomyces orinoci]
MRTEPFPPRRGARPSPAAAHPAITVVQRTAAGPDAAFPPRPAPPRTHARTAPAPAAATPPLQPPPAPTAVQRSPQLPAGLPPVTLARDQNRNDGASSLPSPRTTPAPTAAEIVREIVRCHLDELAEALHQPLLRRSRAALHTERSRAGRTTRVPP